MRRDAYIIDSLKTCTENLKTEKYRYQSASTSRDQWFKDYSACIREVDTLYLQITDLEADLEKCRK